MRTADLIQTLSRDLRPVGGGARARLPAAALAGGALALVVMTVWLGPRDLSEAVRTGAFWMKLAYTAALAATGCGMAARLARPGGEGRGFLLATASLVAVMVLAGLAQLALAPPEARLPLWLGHTWRTCALNIALVAAPAFGLVMGAMRRLAPTSPAAAGAAAGLAAGAIGATAYGLHCPETAPAFIATWYSLGVAACTGLGAAIGSRLLRW